METIKFANGEVRDCSFLSTIPDGNTNMAIIALANIDFASAAAVFSDEDKTAEMEWTDYRLMGYTELLNLSVQPYGIQAMLRGGHNEPR